MIVFGRNDVKFFKLSIFGCGVLISPTVLASDLPDPALNQIAANYKACIKDELIASTNEDGSLDEVFFLEGKEHCDKMKGLQERRAQSEARISQITADLIRDAKRELGLN